METDIVTLSGTRNENTAHYRNKPLNSVGCLKQDELGPAKLHLQAHTWSFVFVCKMETKYTWERDAAFHLQLYDRIISE